MQNQSNLTIEDYLQSQLDREGTYRGFPLTWTVEEAASGAVAIAFQFGIMVEWGGREAGWGEAWPAGYFTTHRAWVVKKDGTLNTAAIDALGKAGLWDGDWDKISGPVPKVVVLLDVKAEHSEQYGTRYRADWVNPNADEPAARGGFKPADTGLLSKLSARFQGQTRALAAGAPAPGGASPQPQAAPQPHPQSEEMPWKGDPASDAVGDAPAGGTDVPASDMVPPF